MSVDRNLASPMRGRLMIGIGLVVILAVIAVIVVIATNDSDDDSDGDNEDTPTVVDVTDEPIDDNDQVTATEDAPPANSDNEADDTLVDRTNPQTVGEAVIRAILEKDEATLLTYICEIDQRMVDNNALTIGYIFEHTSSFPTEGTFDASGITASVITADDTLASLEYSGDVIVTSDDNSTETITIDATTFDLKNINGEWGFCVQDE